MEILWRLLLGHFLADFTFQFDWVNRWKRSNLWGMFIHCAMHPVAYAVLTWPFLGRDWVSNPLMRFNGWACLAIIFAAHFVEDQWRVFTIQRYRTPDNTLYFLWDQFIHYAVIFALIPLSAGEVASKGLFPEKWPVLGCLAVLVTHACTVMVYFIEKDFFGAEFPEFREKYVGMGERLALFLMLLLPGAWPAIPAAGWIFVMHYIRHKKVARLSWLSFYLGGAATVACGLVGRYVLYH